MEFISFLLFAVTAGSNRAGHHSSDLNAARLERETEELQNKTVSADVGRAMIKARADKVFTF